MSKRKKDKPQDKAVAFEGVDSARIDPQFVAIAKNRELHRTIRTLGIGVCILAGMSIVGWVIIATFAKDPPWVKLASNLLAILAAALFVGTPTLLIVRKFRIYMKRDHDRTIKMEAEVDVDRTSSGINKDGTSELDD